MLVVTSAAPQRGLRRAQVTAQGCEHMGDGMSKVRWGILSTAAIGTEKVIPAMQRAGLCEVAAIASRNLGKAQAAADRLGIAAAYGSYEELLADPDIDAVYNPLPNHLHVPWSIRALEAGKHVLCEKPIGLTSSEGQQLVDALGEGLPRRADFCRSQVAEDLRREGRDGLEGHARTRVQRVAYLKKAARRVVQADDVARERLLDAVSIRTEQHSGGGERQ